jgi:hypothetical protein
MVALQPSVVGGAAGSRWVEGRLFHNAKVASHIGVSNKLG